MQPAAQARLFIDLELSRPLDLISRFLSLCNLRVIRASVVKCIHGKLTKETQRTPSFHRGFAGPRASRPQRAAGAQLFIVSLLLTFALPVAAQRTRTATTNSQRATPGTTAKAPAPSEIDKLLVAGQDAHQARRYDEAIAAFNRVITLSATNRQTAAVASFLIGNVNMTQRKFGNAEIAYERAITLNPSYSDAWNNLGEARGELKQFPRALEAFNKAVALDPTLLKARYNQAVTYDRMKNFRYSEFVFRNIIKQNPNYSLAYDGLAVTLSKSGRAREAIPLHEKAIALKPEEPSYYFNYAISNLMLGNTAKAMEQQEKLKRLDPLVAEQLASVIVKRQM